MNPTYNDSIFEEALKIISINKSKANSLRLSLLQNLNNDNELILKIRQYLGEFEYDLNILYNIINDLKTLKINNNQNNLNYSINNEEEKNNYNIKLINGNSNIKKSNSLKSFRRQKKQFYLNNLEGLLNTSRDNNKKENKTYSLTINICDGRHFDSNQKKEKNKVINKSNSCKEFIRKNNFKKFGFFNNYKNKNIRNSYKFNGMKHQKYLNNLFLNNLDDEDNINSNLSKNKNDDDNSRHFTYMTDYSLYKNRFRNNLKNMHNLLNSNINKNKKSLKNLNNIYDHYNALLKNNIKTDENQIQHIDKNLEYKINDILTFENPNNFSNSPNNYVPRLNLDKIHDYRNSVINNYHDYQNLNSERNRGNTNNYHNEEYSGINNQRNNMKYNLNNNNRITYMLNDNINNNNYLDNNNSNRYELMNNLNENNHFNNSKDILDEEKKSEMIQNIISIVLQDTNKLNQLQKYFGDEIGEKLLKRDINQDTLFKVVEVLKNYQNNTKTNKNEKNLFRSSRKNYSNNRHNRKINDNFILKDSMNNNGHINKEYPLGLLSLNDYFISIIIPKKDILYLEL